MNEHQKRHQAVGECNTIVTYSASRLGARDAFQLRTRSVAPFKTESSSIRSLYESLSRKKKKDTEEPQQVFTVDFLQRVSLCQDISMALHPP